MSLSWYVVCSYVESLILSDIEKNVTWLFTINYFFLSWFQTSLFHKNLHHSCYSIFNPIQCVQVFWVAMCEEFGVTKQYNGCWKRIRWSTCVLVNFSWLLDHVIFISSWEKSWGNCQNENCIHSKWSWAGEKNQHFEWNKILFRQFAYIACKNSIFFPSLR